MRLLLFFFILSVSASAQTPMRVPITPALSDDGSRIVFAWNGDLWLADSSGGMAERLTSHPSREVFPRFAPGGNTLYFNAARSGSMQVWKMDLDLGRVATQVTQHSEETMLEDITSDGKEIIIRALRDQGGAAPYRIYRQDAEAKTEEILLTDAYANYSRISPDGKKILITREGSGRYRKGYYGSQATQIWLYDLSRDAFSQPVSSRYGCDNPVWMADGSGFYFINNEGGHGNLYSYSFKTGKSKALTHYKEDGLINLEISRDGSTLIFRRLFHYYRFQPRTGKMPVKLEFSHSEEPTGLDEKGVKITRTKDADFSPSGLEIVFEANGDLYAMDTVLKEPNQLTSTPEREGNTYFIDDGKAVLFIKDDGIRTSLCKLTKQDPSKFWWETSRLHTEVLLDLDTTIEAFAPSPDGKLLAYTTKDGKLSVCTIEGKDSRVIATSWDTASFDWSPDSRWLTYSLHDDNFNSDIYLVAVNGSSKAINISQHPDNDYAPRFSPDGKKIAFIGRRFGNASELFFVDLTSIGSGKSERLKLLEKARDLMRKDPAYLQKDESKSTPPEPPRNEQPQASPEANSTLILSHDTGTGDDDANQPAPTQKSAVKPTTKKKPAATGKKNAMLYDLENVQKRIQRLSTNGLTPKNLMWTHDSESILFQARGEGTHIIKAKMGAHSKQFTKKTGIIIRLDEKGKLYWIYRGQPSSFEKNENTAYPFTIYCHQTKEHYQRTLFRHAWRTMRDGFYDEKMNGKNWEEIRIKYEDEAAHAVDSIAFDRVVTMMLGELNASHTGFSSNPWLPEWKENRPWRESVMHLGVLFDNDHQGPGWKIKQVLPTGPADQKRSKLLVGEIILKVNGVEVMPNTYKPTVLTTRPFSTIHLTVDDGEGNLRKVSMLPISFYKARHLHQDVQIEKNLSLVDKLSEGRIGYIHVANMMWDDFQKFERHLYENGAGKDGIIIDVRDNGGGFTTDHLLTALTQPRHAYTIPRNGKPGYPQDRFVYATWDKPITVLCNQNSFSNAEIFTHAISTLKRGKVVGVPTAGGVISAGGVRILGEARLRYPFRGWFLIDNGKDMELNGAKPDYIIWPKPNEIPAGIDKQIEKAVEVLNKEIREKHSPFPKPRYSNRR